MPLFLPQLTPRRGSVQVLIVGDWPHTGSLSCRFGQTLVSARLSCPNVLVAFTPKLAAGDVGLQVPPPGQWTAFSLSSSSFIPFLFCPLPICHCDGTFLTNSQSIEFPASRVCTTPCLPPFAYMTAWCISVKDNERVTLFVSLSVC